MATLGIIGSGKIGGTVARLSVAAGYHVVLSNSRGPETLAELVAELGPLATAGPADQAAEAGELVLVSVPVKAFGDLPVKPLAGKPVLDTGNYYPQRWRQEPGTPVYGTPYGPFSDEVGTPAPAAKIHTALVGAHR
jgi:predicted dinucleotide-binding enzyme